MSKTKPTHNQRENYENDLDSTNDRPVIAILAQPDRTEGSKRSYIAASYVKFVEASGAQVAPVPVGTSDEHVDQIFDSVNGVLFPGGSMGWDEESPGYYRHAIRFWNNAKMANDRGDHFPILGICLGLETMCVIQAGKNPKILSNEYETKDVALPLDFRKDLKESRMFRDCPEDILTALVMEEITYNSHTFGVSIEDYEEHAYLNEFFDLLSTNTDSNGRTFLSTVEARNYPFYGVQWHPEKSVFEFQNKEKRNIPHTTKAVRAAQHVANFFVGQAKKSKHRFLSEQKLQELLIYNHQTEYTGKTDGKLKNFEQCYFFG